MSRPRLTGRGGARRAELLEEALSLVVQAGRLVLVVTAVTCVLSGTGSTFIIGHSSLTFTNSVRYIHWYVPGIMF